MGPRRRVNAAALSAATLSLGWAASVRTLARTVARRGSVFKRASSERARGEIHQLVKFFWAIAMANEGKG